jgi:hypothetical protein
LEIAMFRKLLLTSVASLGLLSPLAGAPKADAHEYRREYRHEHHRAYRVYFRSSCHCGWSFGATFCSRHEAERFAAGYRCRGFEVSIR